MSVEELDHIERYGLSINLSVKPKTILVEGTTDANLFSLAARLEATHTRLHLLGEDLALIAAGDKDKGGTGGVSRELLCLRGLARTILLPSGKLKYRFVGLYDNDKAGREAIKTLKYMDTSLEEYRDVFRLWPVMSMPGNRDQRSMEKTFEKENEDYKGLDWEIEDLLPESFIQAFLEDESITKRVVTKSGRSHRDWTKDEKAKLHRFIKLHANHSDLKNVIDTLRALRYYLLLPPDGVPGDRA